MLISVTSYCYTPTGFKLTKSIGRDTPDQTANWINGFSIGRVIYGEKDFGRRNVLTWLAKQE
jgi:hypothetical protein